MGHNERKKITLWLLEHRAMSLEDLADNQEIPVEFMRRYLNRYRKQGLVLKNYGLYVLSGRGFARLEYLLEIV